MKGSHMCRYKVSVSKVKKSRKRRAARKAVVKGNDSALWLNPLDGHRPVYRRVVYSEEIKQLAEAMGRLCNIFVTAWLMWEGYTYWNPSDRVETE